MDWGLWSKRALRLLLAAAPAAILTALLAQTRYAPFTAKSDIVGYPAFSGFAIANYTVTYLAWVLVFPVLTAIAYAVLGRVLPALTTPTSLLGRPLPDDEAGPLPPLVAPALTTVAVGLTFGLAGAVTLAPRLDIGSPSALVLTAAAYVAFAVGVAAIASRSGILPGTTADVLVGVNAVAAPLTLVGAAAVARDTRITVSSSGAVEWFNWFPWWVAIPCLVLALTLVVRALMRAHDSDARRHVAWMSVTLVALPVAVVLITASLPGAGGPVNLFHEGEGLAASLMLRRGLTPWKDFIGVHGPLDDGLAELMGTKLLQDTRWGALAGDALIWVPLCWLGTFSLLAYVLRQYRAMLVAALVVVAASPLYASGLFGLTETRFVLIPVVILLLALLVRWPSPWLAGAFTFVLVTQVVLTPESGYLVPACALALFAFELSTAPAPRWRLRSFPRVVGCGIWGAGFLVVVFTVLAARGALGDFVDFFRTFSRGHALTGGIPIQWEHGPVSMFWATTPGFAVALFTIPILLVVSFWYVVARTRARRPLELEDWAMGALALFLVPYYMKALSRPDGGHVLQPWGVAFPLVVYIAARLLRGLDQLVRFTRPGARAARHGLTGLVTGLAVTAIALTALGGLRNRADATPARFLATAPTAAAAGRIGYIDPAFDPTATLADLDRVLAAGGPTATVFDFSNSPAIFYYLRDDESPTRYYHVSSAIRRESQQDLIRELRTSRPDLVVFDNIANGDASWDGIPNMIRHYAVSSYLLDNYAPLATVDGFTVLSRRGSGITPASVDRTGYSGTPPTLGAPEAVRPCDWGRVPEFLDDRPGAGARATTVGRGGADATRVAIDIPDDPSAYQWLEITNPEGIRPGELRLLQGAGDTELARFRVGDTAPERLYLRVGSCAQWHWAAQSGAATIESERPQALRVRLIRERRP